MVPALQPEAISQQVITRRTLMAAAHRTKPETHVHGPENAEHELRKAYNLAIETGVTHFWDHSNLMGAEPHEISAIYKKAYQAHRQGKDLAAERWARTAKHLARAVWHESKIAYLRPRINDLPHLEGATAEEYNLHEHSDTTSDLIDSVTSHAPPGMSQMPEDMRKYAGRARLHLDSLNQPGIKNELLRAETIKAAHEYGRVLECMALAYEAEHQAQKTPPSPKAA